MIDNSSLYRMDPDVPLIVPEVNSEALAGYRKKNIIANPNCSTAQLVVALKPLHDAAKIKRVVVATYQSVSGTGKAAMDELFNQSRNIFVGDSNEPEVYPKQIAFNVIPQAGDFLDDGSTTEEWKLVVETKKILDPVIKLTATCVRVPVFVGHSEAVNVEFENEISADQARSLLREAPGVMVVDKREPGGYVTPVEASVTMQPMSAASGRIRRSKTVSACGSSATICARARRSTRCRSPSCSAASTSRRRPELGLVAPVAQQLGLNELKPGEIIVAHVQSL